MTESTWGQALARTRKAAFGRLAALFGATELSPAFWEDLEAGLIQADLGVDLVLGMLDQLQEETRQEGYTTTTDVLTALQGRLIQQLDARPFHLDETPTVVTLIGVNGSGKTTSAARLAQHLLGAGKTVLIAAADTYRAAAGEQLQIWGSRLGVDVIQGAPGSDPGAVVYEAGQAALGRKTDVLLVDTSGRMHTEHNLMEELKKIMRVAGKVIPGAPHENILILDATTGQNGLQQAKAFAAAVPLTGIILAKLDSSAKGGVGFAVQHALGLPILFVGLGESAGDLAAFDPQAYTESLLRDWQRPETRQGR